MLCVHLFVGRSVLGIEVLMLRAVLAPQLAMETAVLPPGGY